jgi:hypothetical protein
MLVKNVQDDGAGGISRDSAEDPPGSGERPLHSRPPRKTPRQRLLRPPPRQVLSGDDHHHCEHLHPLPEAEGAGGRGHGGVAEHTLATVSMLQGNAWPALGPPPRADAARAGPTSPPPRWQSSPAPRWSGSRGAGGAGGATRLGTARASRAPALPLLTHGPRGQACSISTARARRRTALRAAPLAAGGAAPRSASSLSVPALCPRSSTSLRRQASPRWRAGRGSCSTTRGRRGARPRPPRAAQAGRGGRALRRGWRRQPAVLGAAPVFWAWRRGTWLWLRSWLRACGRRWGRRCSRSRPAHKKPVSPKNPPHKRNPGAENPGAEFDAGSPEPCPQLDVIRRSTWLGAGCLPPFLASNFELGVRARLQAPARRWSPRTLLPWRTANSRAFGSSHSFPLRLLTSSEWSDLTRSTSQLYSLTA